MEALDCLKKRRSVRRYRKESIPKEILEDIIDCARLAPSARNEQPCEFVAVTDAETLRKIADITDHGKFIKDAAACILVCSRGDAKYYLEDGSAATENILLAAKAHNVGSCWVAGDKKTYCDKIKGLLGIPESFKLISIVPLGYYDIELKPPAKRKLKDVLHWEKF